MALLPAAASAAARQPLPSNIAAAPSHARRSCCGRRAIQWVRPSAHEVAALSQCCQRFTCRSGFCTCSPAARPSRTPAPSAILQHQGIGGASSEPQFRQPPVHPTHQRRLCDKGRVQHANLSHKRAQVADRLRRSRHALCCGPPRLGPRWAGNIKCDLITIVTCGHWQRLVYRGHAAHLRLQVLPDAVANNRSC